MIYSGAIKIATHLDHTSHCKTSSGINWSNRWTNRVVQELGAHHGRDREEEEAGARDRFGPHGKLGEVGTNKEVKARFWP